MCNSELFNYVEDETDVEEIQSDLERKIKSEEEDTINMLNEDMVRETISQLKNSKNDLFTYLTTYHLQNAPENLISALTSLFQACLVHSYVPGELLIAKIVPLLKDSNGDVSSTDNYRSICLSSIFLKIMDWIVIFIYRDC